MEKQDKNEGLQSRREFFKKAAKSALPMIAAVALANVPTIVNASNIESGCSGCSYSCQTRCDGCVNSCARSCTSCSNGCERGCHASCYTGCNGKTNAWK